MLRRTRPSALDVSFRDDAPIPQPQHRALGHPPSLKRKRSEVQSEASAVPPKKRKLPPNAHFILPKIQYMKESANARILGEDDDMALQENEKPIRNLFDFTIFDQTQKNQIMSLDALNVQDSQLSGFGKVSAYFENEEEEGQEADLAGDVFQWVLLEPILRVSLDYTKDDAPLYIETENSWYILQMPSTNYSPYLFHFFFPHRISQILVSGASSNSHLTYQQFKDQIERTKPSLLGNLLTIDDMNESRSIIQNVVYQTSEEHPELRTVPIVRFYLNSKAGPHSSLKSLSAKGPNARKANIDLVVLQNQSQTTVTPFIYKIAQRYVRENLYIVGPQPSRDFLNREKRQRANQLGRLHEKLADAIREYHRRDHPPKVEFHKERGAKTPHAITIDGILYEVGDAVIVPIGTDPANSKQTEEMAPLPAPTDEILKTKSFEDYFWFARIMLIDEEKTELHVQWFNHGQFTVMMQISNQQEVFLQPHCAQLSFSSVVGKIIVHYLKANGKGQFPDTGKFPLGEYFCKFEYEPETGVFTTMREEFLSPLYRPRTEICGVCDLEKNMEQQQYAEQIDDQTAVAFRGYKFHVHDYILYESSMDGPGHIGQIVRFNFPTRATSLKPTEVVVKKLGRISSLKEIMPPGEFIDERELFIIDDKPCNYDWIPAKTLIRVVHVMATEYRSEKVERWILHSSDHFYIRYRFSLLEVKDWDNKTLARNRDLLVCLQCHQRRIEEVNASNNFLEHAGSPKNRFRALDVFGGSGAFGIALAEGSSFIDVTHAIEIAPSAAQTYRMNSPNTAVHNICVNDAVQYLERRNKGINDPDIIPVNKLTGEREELPFKPGDIDVIVAGFPCQPHSTQNMYKNAKDLKTNLILPLLSLVDILRPSLIVLENVLGFVFCRLMSRQNGRYRVEGGIKQGALKLLVRALIEMGYQVRFSPLQAAHYGAPQGRARFFLIAALPNMPLPAFPQPTHYFPRAGVSPRLRLEMDNGRTVAVIRTAQGTALFPMVTIADAVDDLRRFDWKHPWISEWTPKQRLDASKRAETIPSISCTMDSPWWGLSEQDIPYEHSPKTRFQLQARRENLQSNIQHYTRKLPLKTAERVINVQLFPGSDHQGIPEKLAEFQYWNPASSVAKNRSKLSLYKRLDPQSYFRTTITNVSPTAKQSAVIHPLCRRILTVRELLRSQGMPDDFAVCALDNNVITHRAVGNAVPWPLSIALGREIKKALQKKWEQREEIIID